MSPSVGPPATPPSVSQDDNIANIVGSVLAITTVVIGKLFYFALLEFDRRKSINLTLFPKLLTLVSCLTDTAVAAVVISVLVCLKKRKTDTTANVVYAAICIPTSLNVIHEADAELMDNAAYQSHNMELEINPNSAYNALSTAIPTTNNEVYASTNINTSLKTTYEVIQEVAEDTDIDTKPNEAYVATDIATSVNEAYQPVQSTSDNTPVYDYAHSQ